LLRSLLDGALQAPALKQQQDEQQDSSQDYSHLQNKMKEKFHRHHRIGSRISPHRM
jgi:hypothetical protein